MLTANGNCIEFAYATFVHSHSSLSQCSVSTSPPKTKLIAWTKLVVFLTFIWLFQQIWINFSSGLFIFVVIYDTSNAIELTSDMYSSSNLINGPIRNISNASQLNDNPLDITFRMSCEMDFTKWKHKKKNETCLYGFQYEFTIAFGANVKWFSFGFLSLWEWKKNEIQNSQVIYLSSGMTYLCSVLFRILSNSPKSIGNDETVIQKNHFLYISFIPSSSVAT